MFENVMKFIFGTVEDDVKTILKLEKSIQSNKDEALELSKEFTPIINKLNRDSRIMNTFCKSKTNQAEKVDDLITLGKIDSKLEKAKSEYHKLLGELRKSNQSAEDQIEKLFKKEKVKVFYEAYVQKRNNVENLIKGFSSGLLDYDKLEKCHNFISREKVGEGFIYTYKEDELIKGEPTEAQKHAGNYKKEKKRLRGLVVSIENKKGSTRSGKSEDGKEWSVTMNNDYGYFNRTLGKDGDHIDVFLSDKPEDGNIYIIDQSNEKGEFDEHKVMMGFKSSEDALKNYKSNFEKDFDIKYNAITEVEEKKFKKWLNNKDGGWSQKRKPFSELKSFNGSEESEGFTENQLKEMISEHERLIKVLESVPNKTERIKSELKIQKEELEKYKKDLVSFSKSIVTIENDFNVFDEFEPDLYKSEDGFLLDPDYIEKATGGKDISKLTKKVIMVTRGGKTFKQTVYVSTEDDKKEVDTPIGEEISPDVKGLNMTQYSDKAIFIGGDTYANLDLMRDIKKEVGVGTFNKKLGGWFFPAKYKEEVLGIIYSDVKNSGDDEKAEAIKNQKNALDKGTEVNIGEVKGKIEKEVSDSDGTKYNIKTEDGTKLDGVDEKVLDVKPEKDDKKIVEIQNNASAESRVKTEKQLYGIKPVTDIHKYSLKEYMVMHGLTDEDVQKVINSFKNKDTKKEVQKRASSGGSKKEYTGGQIEGLTKRQLIGKLVYAHYQAVKKAIENGEELNPEVLDLYEELKSSYSKKRQAMSEETKRKIAEALRKNKVPEVENPQIKKENEEAEEQGGVEKIDKENYKPKDGEVFEITSPKNTVQREPIKIHSKDYTDIPALDVKIPKQKDILEKDTPYFIPRIDEEKFRRNGYTIPAVKVGEDQYLVALDGFTKGQAYLFSLESVNKDGDFAIMSLDTYAATQKYYQLKAKAESKQEAIEKHQRAIDNLKLGLDNLRKKAIDGGEVEKRRLEFIERHIAEKEKQKPKQPRLKVYDKPDKMASDQMYMIQAFNRDDDNNFVGRQEGWRIYREELFKDREQKQIDIDLQQEHDASAFTKGRETSYGDSGVKDDLLKDYGVKVKRQNGDEIKKSEIDQIKSVLDDTAKLFGNNIQMNKEFGLKISHSGNVKMHASKATGVFFPFYSAIGISNEYGGDMFKFVFGHEYAHFMDYWVGKQTGNHFASDKQGSIANKIASTFRKNMNEKQSSNYMNRTCECFARAFEQYTAIESTGENAIVWDSSKYFDSGNYINKEKYKSELKPLIEQFLKENKELLKSIGIELFSEESEDILEKARTGKYADNPQNRQLKRVGQPYGSKAQEEAPKGQKTGKKEEDSTSKPKGSIEEQAKTASGSALETAAKEASDPEVRTAAHNELDRRSKEEAVQEEEETPPTEKKKEESTKKEEKKPKESELNTKEKDKKEEPKKKDGEVTDLTGGWPKASEVETGQPVKFNYSHNTEKADVKFGKRFAQDIEPHGKYISSNNGGDFKIDGYEYGEVEFKNPLVIEHVATDASGWKGELANKYGKKGKALSKELIKRGYDGIITVDSGKYNELSEIVSLKEFDPEYKDKRKTVEK
jgi:hypothetical protein